MKILITCFEPFGVGRLINRNESQVVANKIQAKYKVEVIVLPVDDSCVEILVNKIKKCKPKIIIGLGQGPELRIETKCHDKTKELKSEFAESLKNKLNFVNEEIGDWYCNDVYYTSLSRVKNTVFIHVPRYVDFEKVDKIIKEIIKKT